MEPSCTVCACSDPRGTPSHAVADALARDDLDQAMETGLLAATPCPGCSAACTRRLMAARDARLAALAARERFRAREARLRRRAQERAAGRAPGAAAPASGATPALPPAAASALARAKARAAARHKP